MSIDTHPGTLSVADTAAILGVSTATLYRLVADGTTPIPALRIGTRIRFSAKALDAYLDGDAA